jgi:FixJ family two-component response regulator
MDASWPETSKHYYDTAHAYNATLKIHFGWLYRTQVAARLAQLTPREREVTDFLVQAYPNRLIAETLGIGERTVETHRQRIMDKMEVDTVAELVRLTIAAPEHP